MDANRQPPGLFHRWYHHAFLLLAVTHFAAFVWGDFSEIDDANVMKLLTVSSGFLGAVMAVLYNSILTHSSAEVSKNRLEKSAFDLFLPVGGALLAGVNLYNAHVATDITFLMVALSWLFIVSLVLLHRHAWRRWDLENSPAS